MVKALVEMGITVDLHTLDHEGRTLLEYLVLDYDHDIFNFLTSRQ